MLLCFTHLHLLFLAKSLRGPKKKSATNRLGQACGTTGVDVPEDISKLDASGYRSRPNKRRTSTNKHLFEAPRIRDLTKTSDIFSRVLYRKKKKKIQIPQTLVWETEKQVVVHDIGLSGEAHVRLASDAMWNCLKTPCILYILTFRKPAKTQENRLP